MRIILVSILLLIFCVTRDSHIQDNKEEKYLLLSEIKKAKSYLGVNSDSVDMYCMRANRLVNDNTPIKITNKIKIINLRNLLLREDYPKFKALLKNYKKPTPDKTLKIKLLLIEGDYYKIKPDLDSCKKYYLKALGESDKDSNICVRILCLNSVSWYYRIINEKEKALDYDFERSVLLKKINNLALYIKHYIRLANSYSSDKNYIKAREFYKKALVITENTVNKRYKAKILNNIGTTYETKKDAKIANFYYKQSVKATLNLSRTQALAYRNISNVYLRNNNLDSAKYYINLSSNIYSLKGIESLKYTNTLKTKAEIYIKEEKYEKANQEIEKAIIILNNIKSKYRYSDFLKLNLKINLFTKNDNFKYLSDVYSREFRKTYKPKNSISHNKRRDEIETNSFSDEILKLKSIDEEFSLKKKENNKKELTLTVLLSIMSLLLVLILHLCFIYRNSYIKKKKNIVFLKTSLSSLDIFLSAITNEMQKPFLDIIKASDNIIKSSKDENKILYLKLNIEKLNQSATQIYLLINNLLIWSTTQNNKIYSKKENYGIENNLSHIKKSFPKLKDIHCMKNYSIYANEHLINFILKTILNYIKSNSNTSIYIIKEKKLIILSIQTTEEIFNPKDSLSGLNFRLCKNLSSLNNANLVKLPYRAGKNEIRLSIDSST